MGSGGKVRKYRRGCGEKLRRRRIDYLKRLERRWERERLALTSELMAADLTILNEPCILLVTHPSDKLEDKLVAWFPERQLVGLVSNTLLPSGYVPLASCFGFVCGMHTKDIFDDETTNNTVRVAVCNPTTGFQLELPPLEVSVNTWLQTAHRFGELEVLMTPAMHAQGDENGFSVHVVSRHQHEGSRTYSVYTFNSGSGAWDLSRSNGILTSHLVGEFIFWPGDTKIHGFDVTTRSWTAVPGPSMDIPRPPEFLECSYHRWDLFRYGSKIMMAGQCAGGEGIIPPEEKAGIVILELEMEGLVWKVITSVSSYKFNDIRYEIPAPLYEYQRPLICGKLLVFPMVVRRLRPIAFHLEHGTWLEVPSSASRLPLQTSCIYNP